MTFKWGAGCARIRSVARKHGAEDREGSVTDADMRCLPND